jgi:hypothetical protein
VYSTGSCKPSNFQEKQVRTYEEVKREAERIAYDDFVTVDEVALILIHHEGYDKIDFSGGLRSDPDDDTVPIRQASVKKARPGVLQGRT